MLRFLIPVIGLCLCGCGNASSIDSELFPAIKELRSLGVPTNGTIYRVSYAMKVDKKGRVTLGSCYYNSNIIVIYINNFNKGSSRNLPLVLLHEIGHCKGMYLDHHPRQIFPDGCQRWVMGTGHSSIEGSHTCWEKHKKHYALQILNLINKKGK